MPAYIKDVEWVQKVDTGLAESITVSYWKPEKMNRLKKIFTGYLLPKAENTIKHRTFMIETE